MKNTHPNPTRNDWHTITNLQLAITRAILAKDRRGEAVLRQILTEELAAA